ncbi:MAG: hypothetical protein ACI9MC_002148 [Kiritimatiellia bacterium]
MRYVLTGAIALIIGIIIGIVPGRIEVADLEAQIEELKKAPRASNRAQAIQDLIIRSATAQPPAPAPSPNDDQPDDVDEDGPTLAVEGGGFVPSDLGGEQVEAVKEMLSLRRAQARAALREQVDPTEGQQRRLDEAFDAMNRDLDMLARDVLATLEDGEPDRRDMMEFAAEALDVVLVADDVVLDTLSDGERAGVSPETLDPLSYIDPALVDVFRELGQ